MAVRIAANGKPGWQASVFATRLSRSTKFNNCRSCFVPVSWWYSNVPKAKVSIPAQRNDSPLKKKRVTVAAPQNLTQDPATEWPLSSCIVFRFIFAYMLFFLGSFSAFFVPLSYPLAAVSQVVWGALIPWVADHILLVSPPPLVSDGDGLGQWIQFGGCATLAVVATLIWSVAVRRRKNYATLHAWLRVILRYALGIAMVTYGLFKVFHLQTLPPHLAKLVQPYGDSSPT